jgi:3-oxoacyl-[acyl-carrier-protein] synthase II
LSKRRVVVTGMGIISPVGSTLESAWTNVVNGVSGIGPITRYDPTEFPCRFGGAVKGFELEKYLTAKEARRIDEFIHYGIAAGADAMADSGLDLEKVDLDRAGVIMGSGIGGLERIQEEHKTFLEAGNNPRKISPFFVPSTIINMISGHLSIRFGLRGPNFAVVSACTTSTHALGVAMRTIQYGDADIVLAGGSEMATTVMGVGGFGQAKALSTRNDSPTEASRPWDRDRDGFVLSDGGGAVVLEELEHAKARGARIYAELAGYSMTGDAHHITAPPEDGNGARRAMQLAMKDGGLNPADVQYINAHATSTPLGDVAETTAIKGAFGDAAGKLAISATKSVTGHLLGAAGVVEAIFAALSIRDQIAPPTMNLHNPGEGCDLDYVPLIARQMRIDAVLSNSFGFGGTNGTLALRRFTG